MPEKLNYAGQMQPYDESDGQYKRFSSFHRPSETGITADNIANQDVETPSAKDIYERPNAYINLNNKADRESWDALLKVRNKPNATIKIYRATVGDTINDSDWITLSKTYAEEHNAHSLDGKGKILEMEVPVKDIQWSTDSINEWGYFPKRRVISNAN